VRQEKGRAERIAEAQRVKRRTNEKQERYIISADEGRKIRVQTYVMTAYHKSQERLQLMADKRAYIY
jgi:hypothetical protein